MDNRLFFQRLYQFYQEGTCILESKAYNRLSHLQNIVAVVWLGTMVFGAHNAHTFYLQAMLSSFVMGCALLGLAEIKHHLYFKKFDQALSFFMTREKLQYFIQSYIQTFSQTPHIRNPLRYLQLFALHKKKSTVFTTHMLTLLDSYFHHLNLSPFSQSHIYMATATAKELYLGYEFGRIVEGDIPLPNVEAMRAPTPSRYLNPALFDLGAVFQFKDKSSPQTSFHTGHRENERDLTDPVVRTETSTDNHSTQSVRTPSPSKYLYQK